MKNKFLNMSKCLFQFSLYLIVINLACVNCEESLAEIKEQAEGICQDPDVKNFDLTSLAYITPWNKNGVDIVLKYSTKFDIVSPCWFSLKPETFNQKFNVKIEGSNQVNQEFINELKEKKTGIKIIPRMKCEDFSANDYTNWLQEQNAEQFIKILLRRLNYNSLDGIVLECNMVWVLEKEYPNFAIFIKNLYETLKKSNKSLILTIFPYSDTFINQLTKQRFEYAAKYVDYFNIMSYDYYSYQSQEFFNSPITWIQQTLEHYVDYSKSNKESLLKKILIGLPFHGNMIEMNNGQPKVSSLNAKTFTEILEADIISNMKWDEKEKENIFMFSSDNVNYLAAYPSREFYKERLELVKNNNLGGVAIWDVAQGFDIFLDKF